ncbi:MAG: hypothetical protein AUG51_21540 [Acidobacteria bacterium 13_1_20CM_3_53_8]|nr:MAG: hypothetical protein AUG51_21540 [Acidobacteria bacterium 13_1_20CM_3_53_8]
MEQAAEGRTREETQGEDKNSLAARPVVQWLDRALVFWLFLFALTAPHSIAASQTAWAFGLFTWILRLMVRPRPLFFRTPLDYPLIAFVAVTIITALTSYAPDLSIGKLPAVSLFTIVYLTAENIKSRKHLRLLALALVASCMVNVVYSVGERIVGRGIKIEGLSAESPLAAAGIHDGDTLLSVDGRKLREPEELVAALDGAQISAPAVVKIYRFEWIGDMKVPRGRLRTGATPIERLGVKSWSRGREWRASGFYGLYVTYADVLQLIGSLAFGLFIALKKKRSMAGALLLASVAGISFALIMTVTRAAWLAFLCSALLIVIVGASRRAVIILLACALPVALAGLFVLQQKRNVRFFDPQDQSTTWRETVWREGVHLLVSKPRHMVVGVGMDSIKRYGCSWGLFDNCRQPMGHFHSNLLQFAIERGLPALIIWLILIFVYARMLWRTLRSQDVGGWIERGIVLGALGGLLGFLLIGIVHYNWGDSEVVDTLYFIMGLSIVVWRMSGSNASA